MRRADVVELVDTPDLGSGGASRGGSSPFVRTIFQLFAIGDNLGSAIAYSSLRRPFRFWNL